MAHEHRTGEGCNEEWVKAHPGQKKPDYFVSAMGFLPPKGK